MHNPLDPLDDFLRDHGIRHFTADEVVQLGRRKGSAVLTMPKRSDWWHCIPTLRYLDEIRDRLNEPIRILSGYRSPAYNRAVGGAGDSMHLHFNAFDWRPVYFDRWIIEELEAITLEVIAGTNLFGLGIYEDRNPEDNYKAGFIHLDTRGIIYGREPWNGRGLTG